MNNVADNTEKHLIEMFSKSQYFPNESLPSERTLAEAIGVNRCSLRTVLKAMESDGWISMRHGSSTKFNGFYEGCNLNAALKRADYIEDTISEELLKGALSSLLEITVFLIKKNQILFPEEYLFSLYNSMDSRENFVKKELTIINWVKENEKNNIYQLLFNQLIPLYLKATVTYLDSSEMRHRLKEYQTVNDKLTPQQYSFDSLTTA